MQKTSLFSKKQTDGDEFHFRRNKGYVTIMD